MAEKFGDRLKREMRRKGWNQKDLAAKTGINAGAVSRHLKLEDPPSVDSVTKYAKALGLSFAFMLEGRDDAVAVELPSADGARALEQVLHAYRWPDDVNFDLLPPLVAEARSVAKAEGATWPASLWTLWLERTYSQRLEARGRLPRRESQFDFARIKKRR